MTTEAHSAAVADNATSEPTNFERLTGHLPNGSLARALLDAWMKGKKPEELVATAVSYREPDDAERSVK